MKHFSYLLCLVCLFLILAACTASTSTTQVAQPTLSSVSTASIQMDYSKALERWKNQEISNYEVTVEVYSSLLFGPPCSMKTVLIVQDNKLISTRELETPMPIQMPNGELLYNSECHDYENYLLPSQFELLDKLLKGQYKRKGDEAIYEIGKVDFDAEYGYIHEIIFGVGESIRDTTYSNFKPK